MRKVLIAFLFTPLIIFAQTVVYKVYYDFFPAGRITILLKNNRVIVKGKSEGIVSWFYKYKLYMDYRLNNPEKSVLIENENGKKRIFNYEKILRKKAWLPLVINILVKKSRLERNLKVGNYTVILKRVKNNNYFFTVKGSKKTKAIILNDWNRKDFPEKIVIETSKGEIKLEKINR